MPALVAQLDARPTDDQEVVGFDPIRVGNFLSIPSADSKRAVVGFWLKNVHNSG